MVILQSAEPKYHGESETGFKTHPSHHLKNKYSFSTISTKRSSSSGQEKKIKSDFEEVDAYLNPTELFQWINNGDTDKAINRAVLYPEEVQVWIVSRSNSNSNSQELHEGGEEKIRWRYLPLHLACLQPNPSKRLIGILLNSYAKAAKMRDNDGNLPIHYICSEGHCSDTEIIEMLIDVYPKSFQKRDGKGRLLSEIIRNPEQSRLPSPQLVKWIDQYEKETNVRHLQQTKSQTSSTNSVVTSTIQGQGSIGSGILKKKNGEIRDQLLGSSSSSLRSGSRLLFSTSRHSDEERDDDLSKEQCTIKTNQRNNARVELSTESPQLEKQIKELEEKLDDMQTERDILQDNLDNSKKDLKHHQEKIIMLTSEKKSLEINSQRNNDMIDKLRRRIADLESKVEFQSTDFKSKEKELEYCIESLQEDLKKKNDSLDKYVENFSREYSQMESLKKKEVTATSQYETKILELQETIEQNKSDAQANEIELKSINKELDRHQQKVIMLTSEKNALEIKSKRNDDMLKKMHQRIADLESQLGSTSKELELKEKELEDRVKTFQEDLKEKNDSLAKYVEKISRDFSLVESLRAKDAAAVVKNEQVVKELQDTIQQVKSDAQVIEIELRSKIVTLEADLDVATKIQTQSSKEATSLVDAANEKYKTLETLNHSLIDQMNRLKNQQNSLSQSLKDVSSERDQLKIKMNTLLAQRREDPIRSQKTLQIHDKQQALQKELKDIYSHVKGLSIKQIPGENKNIERGGREGKDENVRMLEQLQKENEEYQNTIKAMSLSASKRNESHQRQVKELLRVQDEMKSRIKNLEKRSYSQKGDPNDSLNENSSVTEAVVSSYKSQIEHLMQKYKDLENKNNSFREIIKKNNSNFLSKVEELKLENARLKEERRESHISSF